MDAGVRAGFHGSTRHSYSDALAAEPSFPGGSAHDKRIGAMVGEQYPGRFGLLAALPMDDVEATLSEIAFAFDQLNADGVIVVTNYGGNYLGNSRFEPVF